MKQFICNLICMGFISTVMTVAHAEDGLSAKIGDDLYIGDIMAEYKQIYDKSKVDWNNAYRKEYGKYVKTDKFTWQQSGDGGGSERIFMKIEAPEEKPAGVN